MSVVIDSNIYVSAFRFRGKPRELIQKALDGELDIAISPSIVAETLRVLKEKFRYTQEQLEDARIIMHACARMVEPTIKLNAVPDDPDDNHILECAVATGAEAIVTGDKDLLRMKEYGEVRMVTLAKFMQKTRSR